MRQRRRHSSRAPCVAFISAALAKATLSIARSGSSGTAASPDFLIQAGGDTYAAGTNNGSPWTLGIADPRGTHDAFAAVQVEMRRSTRGAARVRQGRRPLSPPDRSRSWRARRRLPQRHHCRQERNHGGRVVDRRVHHGAVGRHGADREVAGRRRCDRDRVERGARLQRP